MTSFELGTRETRVRFITWNDILQSESLPEATRRSVKPHSIPVSVISDGQRIDTHVVADALPFGFCRSVDGKGRYFLCLGIEADCGTEPIDVSDFSRTSISKKFALYLAIEEQGIHRSHYGFPNFYIPFITTNTARLASMMRLLERLTGGAGSRSILFRTLPLFTSFDEPRRPSGHMLTDGWQRVGYPPFNFITS